MLADTGADVSGMGVSVLDIQLATTENQAMIKMT
jgi:hypothetical protein